MSKEQPPMSDQAKMNVWRENQRNNQIGGATDGISKEVAADIGFYAPETTQTPLELAEEKLDSEEPVALTQEEATLLNDTHGRRGVSPSNPASEVPGKHGRSNWQG